MLLVNRTTGRAVAEELMVFMSVRTSAGTGR